MTKLVGDFRIFVTTPKKKNSTAYVTDMEKLQKYRKGTIEQSSSGNIIHITINHTHVN
jgi:hypothetical protein